MVIITVCAGLTAFLYYGCLYRDICFRATLVGYADLIVIKQQLVDNAVNISYIVSITILTHHTQ